MSEAGSLRARVAARVGTRALDVALDTAGGTLVVIGPNGAGKTTLLSLILGALPIERGRVEVGGTLLVDTEAGVAVPLEQRRLGYVPQDYALFPHLTVGENLEFALASAPERLDRRARARRIDELLAELRLEALRDRGVRALSGGEQQRVALARTLSVKPRALLLDEPLAALDVHARVEVRSFLSAYLKKLGLPTIVVTHDADDAMSLGDRIVVLEAGAIVQSGTWAELVQDAASHFVTEFVSRHRPAPRASE